MAASTGQTDTKALAAIRPGDPKEKLAAAMGERWREPRPEEAGWIKYLEEHFRFVARLDSDGNVGQTKFLYNFDSGAQVEGLYMLMPEADVLKTQPQLKLSDAPPNYPYRFGTLTLKNGVELFVEVGHGRITRMSIDNPLAAYPDRGSLPLATPSQTFDVSIVPGLRPRGSVAPNGWCCGLPRGISSLQWPLSSKCGFPLEHHFTVRVPEPYRVKGPQYVALALFSDSSSETKVSDAVSDLMNIAFDGRELPETVEPDLQTFLDHLRNRHPMEFRSKDILYSTFAAIWLTEEEFTGAECEPPAPVQTRANAMCRLPDWLEASSAERLFGWDGKEEFNKNYALHRLAGRKPLDKWELLLIRTAEFEGDPNTGRMPVDRFDMSSNKDGYVPKYSEEWDALNIDVSYDDLHFGGTASPMQAMPDLSPFYIEFEERLGMLNFGGGNGQLDLISMQIDWAH
jgi:hypothetical protein